VPSKTIYPMMLLVASLTTTTAVVCTACAREKAVMQAATVNRVDANQVFADPKVAALAEAIVDGEIDWVRELAKSTDLSVRGDKQVTLLQWALLNRNPEALRVLLDAGADPAQHGMDGDTVVHTAALANDPAYLTLLLAHRADANAANAETGASPLHAALIGKRDTQFHALLAAGADPNHADRMKNTPLHVAGQIGDSALALDLLQAGADAAAQNAQGVTFQRYLFMTRTALLTAEARSQREAVEAWLKAHGIAVEGAR
jgi:uncharacterized protein